MYPRIHVRKEREDQRRSVSSDRAVDRRKRWINFSLDIARHFSIHPLFARSNVRMLTNPRATRESRDVPRGGGRVAMPGGQFSPAAISRSILGRLIECDSVVENACIPCMPCLNSETRVIPWYSSHGSILVTGPRFVWPGNATLVELITRSPNDTLANRGVLSGTRAPAAAV